MHGYGKITFENGNVFKGLWSKSLMVEGIKTSADGSQTNQVFNAKQDEIDLKIWKT